MTFQGTGQGRVQEGGLRASRGVTFWGQRRDHPDRKAASSFIPGPMAMAQSRHWERHTLKTKPGAQSIVGEGLPCVAGSDSISKPYHPLQFPKPASNPSATGVPKKLN